MPISRKVMVLAALSVALLAVSIQASCDCSASGDPHYVMCDANTRFDYMGGGVHTMIRTDDVEAQCLHTAEGSMSYIDGCEVRLTSGYCSIVIQTPAGKYSENNIYKIDGKSMKLNEAIEYGKKEGAKFGLVIEGGSNWFKITADSKDGKVIFDIGTHTFRVQSGAKKCLGMCGTCGGQETKPAKPEMFGNRPALKGSCSTPAPTKVETPKPTTKAPTPGPTTSTPTTVAPTPGPTTTTPGPTTTTPGPNTTAYTPKPSTAYTPKPTTTVTTPAPTNATTPAPTNATTPAPPAYTPAPTNMTTSAPRPQCPAHPSFESEEVLQKVIKACLCGANPDRMKTDPKFAGFVENCIYDKSLGPGTEDVAASNMQLFAAQTSASGTPKIVGNATIEKPKATQGTKAPGIVSTTAPPSTKVPIATVSGTVAAASSTDDFKPEMIAAIAEPHVTKAPRDIPADQGVTYQLTHNVPAFPENEPLEEWNRPRAKQFQGAGVPAEKPLELPARLLEPVTEKSNGKDSDSDSKSKGKSKSKGFKDDGYSKKMGGKKGDSNMLKLNVDLEAPIFM